MTLINLGSTYRYYKNTQPPAKLKLFLERVEKEYGLAVVEDLERMSSIELLEQKQRQLAIVESKKELAILKQVSGTILSIGENGKPIYEMKIRQQKHYSKKQYTGKILLMIQQTPGMTYRELNDALHAEFGVYARRNELYEIIRSLRDKNLIKRVHLHHVVCFFDIAATNHQIEKVNQSKNPYIKPTKDTIKRNADRKRGITQRGTLHRNGRRPRTDFFFNREIPQDIIGVLDVPRTADEICAKLLEKFGATLHRTKVLEQLRILQKHGKVLKKRIDLSNYWYLI
jgi:deoxycytidylate deaminase